MSPAEKLTAAAERIEQHVAAGHQLPWEATHYGSRTGKSLIAACDSWDSHAEAAADSADLIVLAVNAMPAVAAWLRSLAEFAAPLEDPVLEAACPVPSDLLTCALAVADQILGGE